jgi:hypothetical protein
VKNLNTDEMLTLESLFDYAIRENRTIHCKPLGRYATQIVTVDKPELKPKERTYAAGSPQGGQGVNDHIYQHMAFWTANREYYWSLLKPK